MGGLELRESRDDDLEAMLDLTQRAHRAVTGEQHPMTMERLSGMRTAPGRDPARDTRVVTLDGRVVAYGSGFRAGAVLGDLHDHRRRSRPRRRRLRRCAHAARRRGRGARAAAYGGAPARRGAGAGGELGER